MKKEDNWVLFNNSNGMEFFYNGFYDKWDETSTFLDGVDEKFIFSSKENAMEFLENTETELYYKPIQIKEIALKSKNPWPCDWNTPKFKIRKGSENEICIKCGINILVDEEYLITEGKRGLCLHCVMSMLSNCIKNYDDVDERYKEIWNDQGKEKAREICSDVI